MGVPSTEEAANTVYRLAIYDMDASRFIIGNAAMSPCPSAAACDAGLQIAVSKTSTPETLTASDWHFIRIERALWRVNGTERRIQSHGDFDKLAVAGR